MPGLSAAAKLALVLLSLCQAPARSPADADMEVFTAGPRVLFRNYALVQCLAEGFPETGPEANAAAHGYAEYGDGPFEAYQKVAVLAHEWLQRHYGSKSGAKMTMMKCIDFTHSRELDRFIVRYIPLRRPKNF